MSYFDDNEDSIIYGRHGGFCGRSKLNTVECSHCGKGGLVWEEIDDGWALVDRRTREVHRCLAKKASDDDFQAL